MAVKNISRLPGEMDEERKTVKSKIDSLGDEMVEELSKIPVKDEDGKKVALKLHPRDVDLEEDDTEEDEEQKEESSDEKSDEEKEGKTDEEASEESETEEEKLLKTKYEKSIQKLERRLHQEIGKRKELEAKVEGKEFKSGRRSKLEAMSETELKQLKTDVRREWKKADDPTREAQLEDLEQEIELVLTDAPKRFEKQQLRAYNEKVQEILDDPQNEGIDFDKEGAAIKQIAEQIYSSKPDLRKISSGQSIALELAVDHYRAIRSINTAKKSEVDLKRKVNTLKKKTSLDNTTNKGQVSNINLRKQYQRAKTGWQDDKFAYLENFVDVDKYLT